MTDSGNKLLPRFSYGSIRPRGLSVTLVHLSCIGLSCVGRLRWISWLRRRIWIGVLRLSLWLSLRGACRARLPGSGRACDALPNRPPILLGRPADPALAHGQASRNIPVTTLKTSRQ